MSRYLVAESLSLRHWGGESTAVVRSPQAGTTHLIEVEALAVLQAVATNGRAAGHREIAHALGLDLADDAESAASLQRIIDGLVQSGLLSQHPDDVDPGREESR